MDEVILSRITKEAYEKGYADGKVDGYNLASKAISSQRKNGKWDTFFSDSYKVHEIGVECSCCGYRTKECTNFCPNCGAEMVKGETDD